VGTALLAVLMLTRLVLGIAHLLSLIPYKNLPRERVRLPKRQKPSGYRAPARHYKHVPDAY